MIQKLALITPWPYQKTGIADYAFDLTVGLSGHGIQVDVFTTCTDYPETPPGVRVRGLDSFAGSQGYDQVVYQMGNSSDFHSEQLPVLSENPGVVHLHDPTLHHLIAFFLYRGDTSDYYRVLGNWYGPEVARRVQEHNQLSQPCFWESPSVREVPFFDPVLQFATGCIVHSDYARGSIAKRFPQLVTHKLPQVYRNMHPGDQASNDGILHVGAFGIVQPHKQLDLVLEALAGCNADHQQVHLHVGGALEESCKHLPELAKSLGIADEVTFYGRMTEAKLLEMMRRVDVCIALRYPTMGETSAVVSRALQLGLPTLVNDVGWYSELPDCVIKLPLESETMRNELTSQLTGLSHDRSRLQEWRGRCKAYALTSCSFETATQQYVELLNQFGKPAATSTQYEQTPRAA